MAASAVRPAVFVPPVRFRHPVLGASDEDTDFAPFANLADSTLSEFVCHPYKKERVPYPNPSKYDDWIPRDTRFDDGGLVTVAVGSYRPNAWQLHDMHGNVAEWTLSAYYPSSYGFIHDLNPDIQYYADEDDPVTMKRKVIRGGSWKDIGYFLQTGTRHWEYQDTTKSYIGFRTALTFLGRSLNDF